MDEGARVDRPRAPALRRRTVAAVAAVAALTVGAACSAGGSGALSPASTASGAPTSGPAGAGPEGASGGRAPLAERASDQTATADGTLRAGGAAADTRVPAGVLVAGRDVVVQGTVTVSSRHLRDTARAAVDAAVRVGGYVEEESTELAGSDEGVRLVLRVPTAAFGRLRDDVAALGEEVSRSTTSDDVTEQVLDVESRLATQRASVERVRALLDRATDLSEVVAVEAELTRRQADLESLQARSAALASQVRLATLVVRLVPPGTTVASSGIPGFLGGLERGWDALLHGTALLATVAGLGLPFLVVAALLGAPVLLLRRRRARRVGPALQPSS